MLILALIAGCKKKEATTPASTPLQYNSLAAVNTTVAVNATTKITASATGEGLTYNWSASNGTIIGSGNEVNYGTPCCAGTATVTCVVKDSGGSSESKSLTMTIQ